MSRTRALTAGERAGLSPGLVAALDRAGAEPRIAAVPCLAARIARLWRGRLPIVALGSTVHWPGARADFSDDPGAMATLQHELQHVLEFATGELTALGYLTRPRDWTYRYVLAADSRWEDFGAEQRACLAEDYLRLCRAGEGARLAAYRRVIPWA